MGDPVLITVETCGPSRATCKCRCPDFCEHKWDGPVHEWRTESGCWSGSATCSRCGMAAIDHDMWVAP